MEPTDLSDISEVTKKVQQYAALKDQLDLLTKRQKEIKADLQNAVTLYGEVDGRGHMVLEINDPITGIDKLTQQRRISKSLDADAAEKILGDKGLLDECLEFIPTINEEAVMAAFYKGQLTEADIDAMFPSKVSYAFII